MRIETEEKFFEIFLIDDVFFALRLNDENSDCISVLRYAHCEKVDGKFTIGFTQVNDKRAEYILIEKLIEKGVFTDYITARKFLSGKSKS